MYEYNTLKDVFRWKLYSLQETIKMSRSLYPMIVCISGAGVFVIDLHAKSPARGHNGGCTNR